MSAVPASPMLPQIVRMHIDQPTPPPSPPRPAAQEAKQPPSITLGSPPSAGGPQQQTTPPAATLNGDSTTSLAALSAPLLTATAADSSPDSSAASALAAALLAVLEETKVDSPLPSASSLNSVLAAIQPLTSVTRTRFFTLACSTSNASATQLLRAAVNFILEDPRAGSTSDPFSRFLYEVYWNASKGEVAAGSLLPEQLFLLNLIPTLLLKFLTRHFTCTAAPSTSNGPAASYAGLFTLCVALYNTERILLARSPGSSVLKPRLLKGLSVQLFDLSGAKAVAATPVPPVLPAILEASQHTMLLVHVLLAKVTAHLSLLHRDAILSLVQLAGFATSSGQAGNIFDGVSSGGDGSAQMWRSAQSCPQRFELSTPVLQDFITGLSFALDDSSATGLPREFVLVSLRQVHCRALEEMRPEILLQTVCMLEQEERAAKGRQP